MGEQREIAVMVNRERLFRRSIDWMVLVILGFGVCYICSLTFVYVDNDDAYSLAYHVLGRNPQLQPPFESFQKGMDVVLSLLPSYEVTVRRTAMSLTAISAIVLVLLILTLAFEYMNPISKKEKRLIAVGILVASPELIYLGLLYSPILTGACFIILAHLALRPVYTDGQGPQSWGMEPLSRVALSSVLMSIGGLFRWDLMAYGLFIVADALFLGKRSHPSITKLGKSNIGIVTIWGLMSLLLWIVLVFSTTDNAGLVSELGPAMKETSSEGFTVRMLASQAMFFSPVFIVLWCWGLVSTLFMDLRLGIVCGLCLPAVLLWPFNSNPKELIVFLPMMITCFAFGLRDAWSIPVHSRWRSMVRVALLLLGIVPWFVGVQVTLGDSSWGPGFQVQYYNHAPIDGVNVQGLRLAGGAAFPSEEGPRPAFGHLHVLLGGWREFVATHAQERNRSLTYAIEKDLPYLVLMDYAGYQYAELAGLGMQTREPERRDISQQPVSRLFADGYGKRVTLIRFDVDRLLKDPKWIRQLQLQTMASKFVVYGYPERIRTLYLFAPGSLEALGPRSAVLDMQELQRTLDARAEHIY